MIDFTDLFNRSTGWCSIHKMENMWREMHAVIERKLPEKIISVELGVFGARSIIPVAHLLKERDVPGIVYGIDPWARQEATKGYEGENQSWWSNIDLPEVLKQAHILVGHYDLNEKVSFITSTSDNSSHLFSKIHFFHCDGQHVFEQFKRDIDNYVTKCISGSPVIIDDVNWCGGKQASEYVEKFCTYKYSIDDCAFYVKN